MERLSARLWGRVHDCPAPGAEAPELPAPKPQGVVVTPLTPEELFRSLLNQNQLAALDNWVVHGDNGWRIAKIPVYGSIGRNWEIRLVKRYEGAEYQQIHVYLHDWLGRERCFHATDGSSRTSLNFSQPWETAAAFLTGLQWDEGWINGQAG